MWCLRCRLQTAATVWLSSARCVAARRLRMKFSFMFDQQHAQPCMRRFDRVLFIGGDAQHTGRYGGRDYGTSEASFEANTFEKSRPGYRCCRTDSIDGGRRLCGCRTGGRSPVAAERNADSGIRSRRRTTLGRHPRHVLCLRQGEHRRGPWRRDACPRLRRLSWLPGLSWLPRLPWLPRLRRRLRWLLSVMGRLPLVLSGHAS